MIFKLASVSDFELISLELTNLRINRKISKYSLQKKKITFDMVSKIERGQPVHTEMFFSYLDAIKLKWKIELVSESKKKIERMEFTGENIRKLRKRKKYSIAYLQGDLKFNYYSIRKAENDESISFDRLLEYLTILEASLELTIEE